MGLNSDAPLCSGVLAVLSQASFIVKWLPASAHEAVLAVELRCHSRRSSDDYLLACLLVALSALIGFNLCRCCCRCGHRPAIAAIAPWGGRTIFDDDPQPSNSNARRSSAVHW